MIQENQPDNLLDSIQAQNVSPNYQMLGTNLQIDRREPSPCAPFYPYNPPQLVDPSYQKDLRNCDQIQREKLKRENISQMIPEPATTTTDSKVSIPDICNLCKRPNHRTQDCENSKVFFHATCKKNLDPILKGGFIPSVGRLGKAVYVSDDPMMCIRFAYKYRSRYETPIILKLRVRIDDGEILSIQNHNQIRTFSSSNFSQKQIKAIRCPYFEVAEGQDKKIYYEFALYKVDYAVVSWSHIKFPQRKNESKKSKNMQAQAVQNAPAQKDEKNSLKQNEQKNIEDEQQKSTDEEILKSNVSKGKKQIHKQNKEKKSKRNFSAQHQN